MLLSYVNYSQWRISLHECDNEALKTSFEHLDMITSLKVKNAENALGNVLNIWLKLVKRPLNNS